MPAGPHQLRRAIGNDPTGRAGGPAGRCVALGEAYVMRRTHVMVLVIGLALLIVGGAGAWNIARPPLDLVLVSGATDIQVQSYALGAQRITYRTLGRPYGWYFTIVRNLAADGWSGPIDDRAGLRTTPEVHWRISSLWFLYIKEQI